MIVSNEVEVVRARDGPDCRMIFTEKIIRTDAVKMLQGWEVVSSAAFLVAGKRTTRRLLRKDGQFIVAQYIEGWLVQIQVL